VWFSCILAWNARASANPPDLLYQAPKECPDEDAFRSLVRRQLGDRAKAVQQLAIEVAITRSELGFSLRLTITYLNHSGHRIIEGKHCDEVVRAAAVVVSLALVAAESPNPPPPIETAPDAPSTSGRIAKTAPRSTRRSENPSARHYSDPSPGRRLAPRGHIAIGIESGSLPSAGLVLSVGGGVAYGRVAALAAAALYPQQREELRSGPPARFDGGAMGLRLCARVFDHNPSLESCALAEVMHIRGARAEVAGSANLWSVGGALAPSVRLGQHIWLTVEQTLLRRLNRARFLLGARSPPFHQTSRVIATTSLRLDMFF